MADLSRKLRRPTTNHLMFWCPGCDGAHQIRVGEGDGPGWSWNGDPERPTFRPSILVQGHEPLTDEEHEAIMSGKVNGVQTRRIVCHSFVTDGKIQFLNDCTHELAGQTVDLPDFES
ncbi:conserved protein of unknown function [Pseudorhizobium banfieldiae]|uniref:Ammonia monooxygenase n=1 Tax=Pseudorhizobium banfieldiae TaxID=1125847 RepID=L0NFV4_9HYPH|nr:DUF6527 family protein [Pseudorhizobium banfieldiae]CAD6606229.1 ammonia monooxygenase [arsenite-oxidising bacterium NT-25]CCF19162.1 conserved protein of unknown function [Pseudorhizobium banfieldiae]